MSSYEEVVKAAEQRQVSDNVRIAYATSSVGFLEGYYSPAKYELFVGGVKRGRLVKDFPKSQSGFKYYLDGEGRLIMLESYTAGQLIYKICYQREGNIEYGFKIAATGFMNLDRLIIAEYQDKRVISYCVFTNMSSNPTRDIDEMTEELKHPEKLDHLIERHQYFYDGDRVTRLIAEQGQYFNSSNSYRETSRLDYTGDSEL